jgi:hypothetical protein
MSNAGDHADTTTGAYIDLLLEGGGVTPIFFLIQAKNVQVKFLVTFKSGESLIFVVFFFFLSNAVTT